MSNLIEALITSDLAGGQWSSCAWDSKTSTSLMTYKGGGAANFHGLSVIRNEFIVSANTTKPLIHIWPINSQDQIPGLRFVTPGKVNCLAISPDGNFLVAGIQESLYIWEICSGKMLNVLLKHYQSISTVRFTKDGSHFVSGSNDGSVLVWNLTKVILQEDRNQQPLYFFNDHALPVADICVGTGGMRAFMCTVSIDRTCRLYDLSSGNMLLNLVFTEKLSCVTMNALETEIFVGTSEGHIYEFNIHSPPRMKEYHVSKDDSKNKFLGHQGQVTCLALSMTGEILASGSTDENIHLWDINSKQLLRTLIHHGHITNITFVLVSKSIFNPDVRLNLVASNLKRMIEKSSDDAHIVEVMITDPIEYEVEPEREVATNTISESKELEELRNEVRRLKKVNKELFEYSVKNVLNNK